MDGPFLEPISRIAIFFCEGNRVIVVIEGITILYTNEG
jgi:hypothetical protein